MMIDISSARFFHILFVTLALCGHFALSGVIRSKRAIFREQVLPYRGGKIPDTAFQTDRLILNRLQAEGIAVPDGIILEQREFPVHQYEIRGQRPTYNVPLGHEAGAYLPFPIVRTTYLIPTVWQVLALSFHAPHTPVNTPLTFASVRDHKLRPVINMHGLINHGLSQQHGLKPVYGPAPPPVTFSASSYQNIWRSPLRISNDWLNSGSEFVNSHLQADFDTFFDSVRLKRGNLEKQKPPVTTASTTTSKKPKSTPKTTPKTTSKTTPKTTTKAEPKPAPTKKA